MKVFALKRADLPVFGVLCAAYALWIVFPTCDSPWKYHRQFPHFGNVSLNQNSKPGRWPVTSQIIERFSDTCFTSEILTDTNIRRECARCFDTGSRFRRGAAVCDLIRFIIR